MRIFLTGTSNSILVNGFRKAFESDRRITNFVNKSFGASGSVAIGQHANDVDFTRYDFCIIDYFVNQEDFLLKGEVKLSDAVEDFLYLIDKCSRSGCMPVVVVFPILTRFNFRRPCQDAVLFTLQKYGVPYFDVYDLIQIQMGKTNLPIASYFMDQMHLKRAVSLKIGQYICDWMYGVLSSKQDRNLVDVEASFRPLWFLSHHSLSAIGTKVRRTSTLAEAELLVLQSGTKLSAKASFEFELAGVSFNVAKSLGVLNAEGTSKAILEIPPSNHFQKRDLTMVAIPFASPPSSQDGEMNLEYFLPPQYDEYRLEAALELSGLIVRAKMQPVRANALVAQGATTALAKLMPSDALAGIADAAAAA